MTVTVTNHHRTSRITKYYRELGCKVVVPTKAHCAKYHIASKAEAAQRRIARLSLPLQFPKSKVGALGAGKRQAVVGLDWAGPSRVD